MKPKTTIFTEQIKKIENIFPEKDEKPLTFEAENLELRQMIRQYCKEKGYYNTNCESRRKSENG